MDLGLRGRTIVVTGASGGIGRAIADTLGAEGARLLLHAHSRAEDLQRWVAERDWAERAEVVRADVGDAAAIERALAGRGRLHGCVVNAGIWPPEDVPLVDLEPDRVDAVLGVNLAGAMWTSRAFLRALRASGPDPGGAGASIVFIGSTAGRFGERGHSDYAASKAALVGLARSLKNEIVDLDPYGRVNVVDPGWVVTEMTTERLDEPGAVERVVRTMPLRQLARPVDVARQIAWLSSPTAARHVSGEVIAVAGGMEGRVLREEDEVDRSEVLRRLDPDSA
ncbi:MAG: SDR family oxidoreductase [Planctomycetota bacterium]